MGTSQLPDAVSIHNGGSPNVAIVTVTGELRHPVKFYVHSMYGQEDSVRRGNIVRVTLPAGKVNFSSRQDHYGHGLTFICVPVGEDLTYGRLHVKAEVY